VGMQSWQFHFDESDSCGHSEESLVPEFAVTKGAFQPPCCVPGFGVDMPMYQTCSSAMVMIPGGLDRGCKIAEPNMPVHTVNDRSNQSHPSLHGKHQRIQSNAIVWTSKLWKCRDDSACGFNGESYRWCHTTNGDWDYCSVTPGETSRGWSCSNVGEEGECEWHGKSYQWCRTTNDDWDYCVVDPCQAMQPTPHLPAAPPLTPTSLGYVCKYRCGSHGEKYRWCMVDDKFGGGWDHCVFESDSTSSGSTCVDSCGFHDQSYQYCTASTGDWDYCANDFCPHHSLKKHGHRVGLAAVFV